MSETTTSKARVTPKWEVDARERLKTGIRRFARPLAELVARDANEGDTRLLVTDLLCDALGYDKYTDLTTEYAVKGEFADYGIRLNRQVDAFIEVKRCTTALNQKHLRQVEMYAVNEGVSWLILTNGAVWQVYKLIAGLPVTIDLVLEVNLLDDSTPPSKKVDALFYLTRESFRRQQIEDVWKATAATAPDKIAQLLLSEAVLNEARREMRRTTHQNIDVADLARLIRDGVLRPELTK